jgi:hypothetical protein
MTSDIGFEFGTQPANLLPMRFHVLALEVHSVVGERHDVGVRYLAIEHHGLVLSLRSEISDDL